MGILSKIFGKKKKSVNYLFSFAALKELFFNENFNIDDYFGNEDKVKTLISKALCWISLTKVNIPEKFYNMPFYFIDKGENKGILFEVPEVKYECDCNFVLLKQNQENKKEYYTNEYFKDDKCFALYSYAENIRFWRKESPKKIEDFFDLV